jgi:hypothetical protein
MAHFFNACSGYFDQFNPTSGAYFALSEAEKIN